VITRRWSLPAAVTLALAGGCGRDRPAEREAPAPAPRRYSPGVVEGPTKLVKDAHLEVTLDLPWTVGGVSGGTRERGWYWRRYTRVASDPRRPDVADLSVEILAGSAVGLDAWRGTEALPAATAAGPVTAAVVCGGAARRQETTVPARDVAWESVDERAQREQGVDQRPAQVVIAVGFRHADQDILVAWIVEAAWRERLLGQEQAFFGSIRCLEKIETP
jgi:hypothetical protein